MTDRRIVFVYFRADPADDAEIDRMLGALRSRLRERLPMIGRAGHGHRHQENPARRTWLEYYEIAATDDPALLLSARAAAAGAIGLPAPRDGGLHTEVFDIRGEAGCA